MSSWDQQNKKEIDKWLSKKTPEERYAIAEQARESISEYWKNFNTLIKEPL